MKMMSRIKEIWNQLSISIYQKERLTNNLNAIKYVGFLFGFFMLLFVPFNHRMGFWVAEYNCLMLGIGFMGSAIITIFTKKREYAIWIITLITSVTISIYTFNGTNNGFAILWALLIPICIMYFLNVKVGILQSLYLELIFIMAFYSPLRDTVIRDKYSETFIQRFPLLYGIAVITISMAMIQYHISQVQQAKMNDILQAEVDKQTLKSEQRRIQVESMSKQLISALAGAIDAKDKYTSGHSDRVKKYSMMIAKRSDLFEENELVQIEYAAALHDMGKIGIPDNIINKPSALTDEEFRIIKTHPAIGADILSSITEMPDIFVGARWHHERFDGRGYPDGKQGTDIPVIARIICVADSYDAMTSNRSYRKYMPQDRVREQLIQGRGTQFDPVFADIMLEIMEEDRDYLLHE